MSKGWRNRWVDYALAVTAVALVAAVFATQKSVTTSEVDRRANNVLSVWRQDALSRLVLTRAGHHIELVRRAAKGEQERRWYIRGKGEKPADAEAVEALLATLRFASWLRTLNETDPNAHEFGLDSPRAELEVEMGDVAYELRVGKSAVGSSDSAYLAVQGGAASKPTVGVVKSEVADALLVDQRSFKGRSFIALAKSELSSLSLSGSGGTRRLVRSSHRFRFEGMEHNRLVDDEALDPLLFQFPRMRAETFLDEATAKQALLGELVHIEARGKGQKVPVIVDVGGKCPDRDDLVVAWRRSPDPIAGCITGQVMAGLTLEADALLDRTAFGFPEESVEEVHIDRDGRALTLKRREGQFAMEAPEKGTVSLDAGNRRVRNIVSTRGELVEAPDLRKLGLEPPRGRAVVRGLPLTGTAAVEETILLGNIDERGRLVVRRALDGQVLRFERGPARAFAVDATLLKALGVLDFEAKELRSLTIKTDAYEQVLERKSGELVLTRPRGYEADASLANDLASALAKLTAERWVSDRDDGGFGLSEPRIGIGFELSTDHAAKRQLLVGNAVVGGAYAKLGDREGVFVLPTESVRALDKLVVSRSGFAFGEANLYELEIHTRDRKLLITRRGDDWTSDALMDPEQASLIVEAALDLRPEVAVHTGPEKPSEGFGEPVCTLRFGMGRDPRERRDTTIKLGASDVWRGTSVHYARSSATGATFVVERGRLRRLLDLL